MSEIIEALLENVFYVSSEEDLQQLRRQRTPPTSIVLMNVKPSWVYLDYLLHPNVEFFSILYWTQLEEACSDFWEQLWQLENLSALKLPNMPRDYLRSLAQRIRLHTPLASLVLMNLDLQERFILLLARALKFNQNLEDFELVMQGDITLDDTDSAVGKYLEHFFYAVVVETNLKWIIFREARMCGLNCKYQLATLHRRCRSLRKKPLSGVELSWMPTRFEYKGFFGEVARQERIKKLEQWKSLFVCATQLESFLESALGSSDRIGTFIFK